MIPRYKVSLAVALCVCSIRATLAQTFVTTDPVGFATTSCLANSDTYLALAFTRPPEFTGTVASVLGSIVTINGTPGWSANQFVYTAATQSKHYYALIGSGGASNPKEGHFYVVNANGSNTLTLDTSADNLAGVVANTKVTLIPFWTPATIFPSSDAGVAFTATTSSSNYKTLLRIPNGSAVGINQSYAAVYFFSSNVDSSSNNVGWRVVGDNLTSHDDDPVLPDSYFAVRNNNGAPTLPLTAAGSVLMSKFAVPLFTQSTQQQDNPVAMIRPVSVTLDHTGLTPFDGSFLPTDQLLLFDNSVTGFDKSPSAIYTFDSGWKKSGDGNVDHNKDLIASGSAMLVRKAAAAGGKTSYWVNSPTYITATSLSPLQAVSRKTHGASGLFDINLPAGGPGIEPRSPIAGLHQVVFTFADNVSISAASVTPGTAGSASISGSPQVNGNQITVNLSNVSNAQTISINLSGVSDGSVTSNISVPVGILLGDVNGNGTVTNADVTLVKGQVGAAANSGNFRNDTNANGTVTNADVTSVKAQVGSGL